MRLGITGVAVRVMHRHAIVQPIDGEPQLITHELKGDLKIGDDVIFDEVFRGARRKT